LDEPCQGLDPYHISKLKSLLDQICPFLKQSLIFVTHYPGEIPACVEHRLYLEAGRIQHLS
ncbi:MAG: ATP-binding cassette domain-containing protein, partial [Chitinophagaceae bacterium]